MSDARSAPKSRPLPPAPKPGRAPSARFLAAGGEAPATPDPLGGARLGTIRTLLAAPGVPLKLNGRVIGPEGIRVTLTAQHIGWIAQGLVTVKEEA